MPKELSILVLCPVVSRGGGERLLRNLIPAISRHPDSVMVHLLGPQGEVARCFKGVDIISGGKLKLTELQSNSFKEWLKTEGRVWGIRGTGRLKRHIYNLFYGDYDRQRIRKQLRYLSRDCDLIYNFWPHHCFWPFPDFGKPVVCTFQDTTAFDFPEIMGIRRTKEELEKARIWLQNSDQIVAPSAFVKENLIRIFGKFCESAVIINHAISPDLPEKRNLKPKGSLAKHLPSRYIVLPSNLSRHKNHYTLLNAWAKFEHRREIPLVLFGPYTEILNSAYTDFDWPEHWWFTTLISLIRRKRLEPWSDFYALGEISEEDVMPIVGNAYALIMPSLSEGGGSYPVEEALSMGVPVLCSDIPVLREHLSKRSADVLWFDPESPDSIVMALNSLVKNYDHYKHSAMNSMADPRPTWDDVADAYVKLFKKVVGSRKL